MKPENLENDLKFYKQKTIAHNSFLYHIRSKLKKKYKLKYDTDFVSEESLTKQIKILIDKI